MKKLVTIVLAVFCMPVNATLVERAGGLAYYDTALDITWVSNANLAQTENFGVAGIKESGFMTLDIAHEWIDAVNTAGYLGLNAWRLPSITPVNGSAFSLDWSEDGSTDRSRNLSAPGSAFAGSTASEMAHMYFNTLGNVSSADINGDPTSCGDPAASCLTETGPFAGLINQRFWAEVDPFDSGEVLFFSLNGFQDQVLPGELVLGGAWAVATGDALVPIPAAVWLFASGLGLLGWKGKRKKLA